MSNHPLSPLSVAELESTVACIKEALPAQFEDAKKQLKFISIMLQEPAKELVLRDGAFVGDGDALPRLATAVCLSMKRTFEVCVDVRAAKLLTVKTLDDVQPAIAGAEFGLCEELVRQDERFQKAMADRGFSDPSKWMVEPWSAGYFGDEEERQRRVVRALVWVRVDSPYDNGYAHPVEGVQPIVDLLEERVLDVLVDNERPTPLEPGNFARDFVGEKEAVKDIEISQPEGVNFSVEGNVVRWQHWQFVVGFNQREGLTLHCIEFKGRPILYRMALSEMVVPYFSNTRRHAGKNAFDVGEYGLGNLINSLSLGCDCVGDIFYFDVTGLDMDGSVRTIKQGLCMHEEDDGILWKHTDWRLEEAGDEKAVEVARSTKLVVSMFCTVGNYEYGMYYNFYQDGCIEPEIKATGLVNTSVLPNGVDSSPFSQTLNLSGLEAQHHQHAFNFRLDFCVDGTKNSAFEWNSTPLPPEENPFGNAVRVAPEKLSTESAAQRDVQSANGRFWTVANEHKLNRVNEPVAYGLFPGTTASCLLQDHSFVIKRAPFMKHHVWVTRFEAEELYAAGKYPNQAVCVRGGLGEEGREDRSIDDTDLVLWHTTIVHHVVRLEDFPVMPVVSSNFWLRPVGFFDENPCMRVPARNPRRSRKCCARE